MWNPPVERTTLHTVKKVGKNISQAPPTFPKARTIQSGNQKRKNASGQPHKHNFINHVYPNGDGPDKNLIEMLER